MTSAQRNFNEVSTLVAEMLKGSKDARDAEIAANNAPLDEQGVVLIGVLLCVIVIGCLVSIVVAASSPHRSSRSPARRPNRARQSRRDDRRHRPAR